MTSLANIKITSKKPRRSRRIAGLPPIIYSKANNLNQTTKCIECNEYYGRIESDNKCSYCFKGIKTMKDPNFQEKLNNYVKSKTDIKQSYKNLLRQLAFSNNHSILKQLHEHFIDEGLYITAKFGSEILESCGRDNKKSHIICSLIIDWWNMVNYKFNATEMCYFGRFGDPYEIEEIKTIPPPPPNRCMVCI